MKRKPYFTREEVDNRLGFFLQDRRRMDPGSPEGKKLLEQSWHRFLLLVQKAKKDTDEVFALYKVEDWLEDAPVKYSDLSIRRFPRIEGYREIMTEIPLRWSYPPYDPHRDGQWDPGPTVLSDLALCDLDELKRRAERHGLLQEGTKFEIVERIYRHWRASKLELGFPLFGYNTGFEKVGPAVCSCGSAGIRRSKSMDIQRFPRYAHRYFPRTKRWPRLARFPRTKRWPRYRKTKKGDHPLWYMQLDMNKDKKK